MTQCLLASWPAMYRAQTLLCSAVWVEGWFGCAAICCRLPELQWILNPCVALCSTLEMR